MPQRTVFDRHVISSKSEASDLYRVPMRGNKNLMAYKALIRRSRNYYAVKVGIFGSTGRTGQVLQGIGTAITPGDLSNIRSPGRSGIYSALVPGGIPGSRLAAPSRSGRGYRCPEGFQYGGRFTDSRFSTCGQMLFDIFTLGTTVGQLRRPVSDRTTAPEAEGQVNVIPGMTPQERQVVISRAAQIPRIGAADSNRRDSSVADAIKALANAEDGATLMIRRDGFGLRPVVSTGILRTVPDNRNMEGATFLTAASSMGTIGKDELGLLSNTGVEEIKYIAPNGVQLSLKKVRPLTVGERRKLGRTVAEVVKTRASDDPTASLRMIADNSNGAVEYSERLGKITKANEFIEANVDGTKKRVRRWVYETFLSGKKPRTAQGRRLETEEPEQQQERKIASLAEAIKHLDAGGDPSEVLPSLLPMALQRTRAYKARRIGRSGQIFTARNGSQVRETTSQLDFQHLGAGFANEIQSRMGLNTPAVVRSGSGKRQPYYAFFPPDKKISLQQADNLDNLAPAEMLRLAVSDWLTDSRTRNAQNSLLVTEGDRLSIIGSDNADAGLSGVTKPMQSARQRLKIDDFLNEERAAFYRQAFQQLSQQQRRAVVAELESLIERASDFSWEEYLVRLNADGVLSQAEQNHLKIMRSIFDARLSALKGSKESFLNLLGVS